MSSTVSKQGRITTRQLTMTALFVALIAVGAFIRVPLPNCPFTLQILFYYPRRHCIRQSIGGC